MTDIKLPETTCLYIRPDEATIKRKGLYWIVQMFFQMIEELYTKQNQIIKYIEMKEANEIQN